MDTVQKNIQERLNQANNILITVSRNPSVDQLSACVGLTLLLNRLGKHATAVFSGEIPSTLEFLEPEKTLEKNTDSLRDFIISLDKSKADKLRYKVEDKVVKIFITPYRTSITDQDLVFSQGDFNVEVVMALGVHERDELDEAIVSHGRILHDATVISVNTQHASGIGTIDWVNPKASSLSEMLVSLGLSLKEDVLDNQIANAFLTGIVAETDRFSNEKTSSETMNVSAKLIAAGGNQQLVASKLQEPVQPPEASQPEVSADKPESSNDEPDDGSLKVDHRQPPEETPGSNAPEQAEETAEDYKLPPIGDEQPPEDQHPEEKEDSVNEGPRILTEPPTLGGTLTANSHPEALDPSVDPLGEDANRAPLLSRKQKEEPREDTPERAPEEPQPAAAEQAPEEPEDQPDQETLADLEKNIGSSHADKQPESTEPSSPSEPESSATPDTDKARDAVQDAITSQDQPVLPPLQSLNAQDLGVEVSHDEEPPKQDTADKAPSESQPQPDYGNIHIDPHTGEIMFHAEGGQDQPKPQQSEQPPEEPKEDLSLPEVSDPTAPPPVPPPMMPPSGPSPDQNDD